MPEPQTRPKNWDITKNAYSKIETNQSKVSDTMVEKLATIFGVSAQLAVKDKQIEELMAQNKVLTGVLKK